MKTRTRALAALLVALAVLAGLLSPASPAGAARKPRSGGETTARVPSKTLILYDDGGDWGYLGELYGTGTANLVGHFGTSVAKPVRQYTAGELAGYAAVVYMGSTYDEAIP